MDSGNDSTSHEIVRVSLELPRDIVDWLDGLRMQLGFRNRGAIVAQLLRELTPPPLEADDADSNAAAA